MASVGVVLGAGEPEQRASGGCQIGQLGVDDGELFGERADLCAQLLCMGGGDGFPCTDQFENPLVVHS
jgi:hypothetical protein